VNTQPTPSGRQSPRKEDFIPSMQELEGHFQHLYNTSGERMGL